MFGLGPISSTSISGGPFKLITVPLVLAASVSITFSITARAGAFIPMSASVLLAISGTPTLWVDQTLSGSGTLTFGGTPTLRVAGKPIILSAVPVSYTLRAPPSSYTLKSDSHQFTVRGVR
jgi:hypothetical protein